MFYLCFIVFFNFAISFCAPRVVWWNCLPKTAWPPTIIENDFDLFLKNLGGGIESTIINIGRIWNYEILNKICDVLNSKTIIKFDKDVKYNFYLVDGKESVGVNSQLNSYKIILKIDAIEEVKSINFFGKDLVSLNNNEFLFFENVNKTIDYGNVFVEDRFTKDEVSKMTGVDNFLNIGGDTPNYYSGVNTFDLLVKHLYNLGIYDIHNFDFSSNYWEIVDPNLNEGNYYNIDRTVYDYKYYTIKKGSEAELNTFLNTNHKNKSFDIIKDIDGFIKGGYSIALKTFPY